MQQGPRQHQQAGGHQGSCHFSDCAKLWRSERSKPRALRDLVSTTSTYISPHRSLCMRPSTDKSAGRRKKVPPGVPVRAEYHHELLARALRRSNFTLELCIRDLKLSIMHSRRHCYCLPGKIYLETWMTVLFGLSVAHTRGARRPRKRCFRRRPTCKHPSTNLQDHVSWSFLATVICAAPSVPDLI
jgi:hypothetical protein